jgi:hypothetical protein
MADALSPSRVRSCNAPNSQEAAITPPTPPNTRGARIGSASSSIGPAKLAPRQHRASSANTVGAGRSRAPAIARTASVATLQAISTA